MRGRGEEGETACGRGERRGIIHQGVFGEAKNTHVMHANERRERHAHRERVKRKTTAAARAARREEQQQGALAQVHKQMRWGSGKHELPPAERAGSCWNIEHRHWNYRKQKTREREAGAARTVETPACMMGWLAQECAFNVLWHVCVPAKEVIHGRGRSHRRRAEHSFSRANKEGQQRTPPTRDRQEQPSRGRCCEESGTAG